MNRFREGHKFWVSIPPWLILGAVAILAPVLIFMALQGIKMQKELAEQLLIEQGDALIRSFEAGARTGAGLKWGDFQLQKLLIETAQQPGIDYLIVTDRKGVILADSEPSQVEQTYEAGPQEAPSRKIQWRTVAKPNGGDTFEVYRLINLPDNGKGPVWVIFVGLDMDPVKAVRNQNTRNVTVTALILLLIAFAGIITLFLAQSYRSARSTLSRIKIFSDSLVENMPMGLIGIDQDGRIVSFNQEAESILMSPASQVLGKKADEILPGPCRNLLPGPDLVEGIVEKEIDCPIGDIRMSLEVIATSLRDDKGALLGYIILLRDMTEFKRLQEELERNRRLASVGNLAAGVAHEIRNPLSSIKGFATYFRERYRDNPDDYKNADIMIQEVERMNRVIGQLLEFARPLEMKKRKSAVEPEILHTVRLVEGQARNKGITIRTRLTPVPDIMIDPDRIKQVLLNLCINAIESMKEGGILNVELNPDTATPGSKDSGKRIRIAISDTGAGIRKEDLPRIFDPYFTTKSSGTGLGLAIVHKIIEAHGGELRISSEPGKGTRVEIVLPEWQANIPVSIEKVMDNEKEKRGLDRR
jgi:two-component system sensor histidine kinase HydH